MDVMLSALAVAVPVMTPFVMVIDAILTVAGGAAGTPFVPAEQPVKAPALSAAQRATSFLKESEMVKTSEKRAFLV